MEKLTSTQENVINMVDTGSNAVARDLVDFNEAHNLIPTEFENIVLSQKGYILDTDPRQAGYYMYPMNNGIYVHGVPSGKAKAIAQREIFMRSLPSLEGSEKQTSWAHQIREKKYNDYVYQSLKLTYYKEKRSQTSFELNRDQAIALGHMFRNEKSAATWINNR